MNDERKFFIRVTVILIAVIFAIKLFTIQVLDSNYKLAAENNIVQKIVEYPFRGLMNDRNGNLLVYNTPIYDLMVVPKEVVLTDTTTFCKLLSIDSTEFMDRMSAAKKYSSIHPSKFVEQLTNEQFAKFQDKLVEYPGFHIRARTVRKYQHNSLANALGYIGEISRRQLQRDTTNFYKQGDHIGISGLEEAYEQELRGSRGVSYKMVNVRGIEQGTFKNGEYDTLSRPGRDLVLTIDLDMQTYAEELMKGKIGSVVALEPSTGEILAFVSAPSYDPNILTGKNFGSNYSQLQQDTMKPLFNRPLMAMYPPGSIFKTVNGLIAMQEGVVRPNEQIYCDGSLVADHAPSGYYDMHNGIKYSSNNYFYQVMGRIIRQGLSDNRYTDARLGLDKWKEYVNRFGIGTPLGIDLPNERGGFVPGSEFYNRMHGNGRWRYPHIYSLSIGQGEILMNPIQMANLGAIVANRGFYYPPHMIKNYDLSSKYKTAIQTGIDSAYYDVVIKAMSEALMGTAPRALVPDLTICGKTGTAQNPHGEDHSVFMAFAPMEDPKIAISVYVENAGWGGRAAGSIASLLIEDFLKGQNSRPWLETYVLKGDFAD
ncbi:MAG: penicillin-binding protein 2 [Cyclobacteriaceae bacterium]